jgi:hypothetical protein
VNRDNSHFTVTRERRLWTKFENLIGE